MFSQSVTTEPPLGPTPSPTTSSSRGSRLRSLSYLRNYAAHHLTRDHSSVAALFSSTNNNQTHTTTSQSQSSSPTASAAHNNNNNSQNNNSSAIDSSSSSSSPTRSNRISRSMSTPTRSPAPVSTSSVPASAVTSAPTGARLTQVASVPASSSPATAPGTSLTNVVESEIEVDSPVIVSSNPSPSASIAAMDSIQDPAAAAAAAATELALQPSPAATDDSNAAAGSSAEGAQPNYSLRLTAFVDPRASRQSLSFPPVHRKLQTGDEIIKVGRYSERENGIPVPTNVPSSAPIGFKSKVVSRRHCEFFCDAGRWFIKDVKSSSGTFLNHVRLSSPGQESNPFRVKDGDIVQLGIDFRGGEETMFRCVKMRVEVNRGWQNAANPFNTSAHERIRNLTKPNPSANNSQDCTICLGRIAPCQTLFVAPCSHTWHFKCIKALIDGPSYPLFNCPNCRATTDLEAEPEEPEGWEMVEEEAPASAGAAPAPTPAANQAATHEDNVDAIMVDAPPVAAPAVQDADVASISRDERAPQDEAVAPANGDVTMVIPASDLQALQLSPVPTAPTTTAATPTRPTTTAEATTTTTASLPIANRRTPSPGSQSGHELMTPRNNAGPWVFDGRDGDDGDEVTPFVGRTTTLSPHNDASGSLS